MARPQTPAPVAKIIQAVARRIDRPELQTRDCELCAATQGATLEQLATTHCLETPHGTKLLKKYGDRSRGGGGRRRC